MNQKTLALLVMLNAFLLAAVAVVSWPTEQAAAQAGGGENNYAMITGEVNGQEVDTIWIVDGDNQRVVAAQYNSRKKDFEYLGRADMSEDLAELEDDQ